MILENLLCQIVTAATLAEYIEQMLLHDTTRDKWPILAMWLTAIMKFSLQVRTNSFAPLTSGPSSSSVNTPGSWKWKFYKAVNCPSARCNSNWASATVVARGCHSSVVLEDDVLWHCGRVILVLLTVNLWGLYYKLAVLCKNILEHYALCSKG